MCGIFGQGAKTARGLNQSNIRILGMFNEHRGKMTCGVTYDGELFHGTTDGDKLWTDFIKKRKFEPKAFPVIFGHTRAASVGSVSPHNAHPFGFGTNNSNDGYKFIGVHNGTLLNYKELAKKYEIDLIVDLPGGGTREKIDSEVILEILYKTRKYNVLNEYNGRAALVWTDTDAPGTVYLWAGKSRPSEDDGIEKMVEERPLFVYVESKNSFYFSSVDTGLQAIGGGNDNVFQIDYNTVYQVKDGNFKDAQKLRISRANNYHTEYSYSWNRKVHKQTVGAHLSGVEMPEFMDPNYDQDLPFMGQQRLGSPTISKVRTMIPHVSTKITGAAPTQKREITNIYYDRLLGDQGSYKDKIYVKKFRYCRNGHGINGVYMDIPEFGLLWMGKTDKEAEGKYWMCIGRDFYDGYFNYNQNDVFDGRGKIIFDDPKAPVPKMYFFLDGIMLREYLDYDHLLKHAEWVKDHVKMSHCSVLPVVDTTRNCRPTQDQDIRYDGELYTGEVCGLHFERTYHITKGNLMKVVENNFVKEEEEKESRIIPIYLPQTTVTGFQSKSKFPFNQKVVDIAITYVKNMEEDIVEDEMMSDKFEEEQAREKILREEGKIVYSSKEEQEKVIEDQEKEIVKGIIEEYLTGPLVNFYECMDKLKPYKSHPDGKQAIKMLDDMTELLETYIKGDE